MNQPSKVEMPKKNAPLSLDVLARQIEALKNDQEVVDPQLERLSEKASVLLKSREASQEELAKINSEFLEILERMQVEHFFEKFAVSESIIRFLRDHPDKKIEDLKPSDFTDNPELQKPNVWKNILEDVRKGMAVAALLQKKDFDWKNPITYLKEKAGDAGKDVLKKIKENPIAFGGCLLLGGIALYQWFKKDSDWKDKIVSGIAGGASVYLGASIFGESLTSGLVSSLGKKLLGEEKWKEVEKIFGVKEKEGRGSNGVETVPIAEAIGNYWAEAKHGLLPLTDLAARNKPALVILSAAGITLSESFRSALLSGTKLTLETAVTLAKIPFKIVKGFPLTSIFAVTAVLLNLERIKKIEIPKDTDNLVKFLKHEAQNGEGALAGLDISGISNPHLKIIAEVLLGKRSIMEFIPPADELIAGIAEKGVELLRLTPEKLIREQNKLGLESFARKLLMLDEAHPSAETQTAVEILRKLAHSNTALSAVDIEKIKKAVKLLGVEIIAEDGRLKAAIKDKEGVVHPRSICVDPSLPKEKQFEIAQGFFIESDNSYERALDALGKVGSIPWQQLRLGMGSIFREVETETAAGKIIEQKLKEGCILTVSGSTLSLIAEGGTKYILGPAEIIWKLLPGGKDYSCVELAIDYAEGLLPVAAFGLASALVRRDWAGIFKGRVLGRTLTYPYYGTKAVLKHLARPLAPRDFNPKAIFTNPAMRATSAFGKFKHRCLSIISPSLSLETKRLHLEIVELNRAKNLLAKANGLFGKARENLLKEAHEILSKIEVKREVLQGQGIHEFGIDHKGIENAIKRTEKIIKEKKTRVKKSWAK
ncbi:MAG: hypothetical protein V2A63_04550 [Patescibacteria group bacterium]